MKRTLQKVSMLFALTSVSLSFIAIGRKHPFQVPPTSKRVEVKENNSSYGVSIGTVDVRYFNNNFFADINDNTTIEFRSQSSSEYVDGEYITTVEMIVTDIYSNEESVIIPDSLRIENASYPVTGISYFTPGSDVKRLTIPATVTSISGYNDNFGETLEGIYFLGKNISSNIYIIPETVFICEPASSGNFINNQIFAFTNVRPYGWEFKEATVEVTMPGEFTQLYLMENDFDWNAVQKLTVKGKLNSSDMEGIMKLTALTELDMGQAEGEIPEKFMNARFGLEQINLPANMNSIPDMAFANCWKLKKCDFAGVDTIGMGAFYQCITLSSLNLKGVESIGTQAFTRCSALEDIDLSTVKYIGYQSFYGCKGLKEISLDSIIEFSSLQREDGSISGDNFANCSSLRSVIFGNSLKSLARESFASTGLESLTLPASLKEVPDYAFVANHDLKTIEFSEGLETIGNNAFAGCTALSSIKLPEGLTTLRNHAFYGCTGLDTVDLPSTVNLIYKGAFNNTGIRNFTSHAVVPPHATDSFIGEEMDMTRTFLNVPAISRNTYKNRSNWNAFLLVNGMTDTVDNLTVTSFYELEANEETTDILNGKPNLNLTYRTWDDEEVYGQFWVGMGQLSVSGEVPVSLGEVKIDAFLTNRAISGYQYCPTLINDAEVMRVDSVRLDFRFADLSDSDNTTATDWHFITLPFDIRVGDIIPAGETYWTIRKYNSEKRAMSDFSHTWQTLSENDVMEAGKGYILSAQRREEINGVNPWPEFTFKSGNSVTKNNIFKSTDAEVKLFEYPAEFPQNASWNLVGNPYPCYYDMSCLSDGFNNPVTVWNGRTYIAYSPMDDYLVLSPYESFFVQCPVGVSGIMFEKKGRLHHSAGRDWYRVPSSEKEAVAIEERNVFNFEITCEDYSDRARIVFNPESSDDYEIGRDAAKFFAEGKDAQIFASDGLAYSIMERPSGDCEALIGIRSREEGEYKLSLSGRFSPDWKVLLTDQETGITTDLTLYDYTFLAGCGESDSRFLVRFLDRKTGVNEYVADFDIDSIVTVTSISGVIVYEGRMGELTFPGGGVYVVSDGNIRRKVCITDN